MKPAGLAAFFVFSRVADSMYVAGILVFLIGLWTAREKLSRARGLDKIAALGSMCFAIPLAVFGALHLAGAAFVAPAVPSYMPWPLFWAYLVGFALLAASLSIAANIQVRWSGLLFGIMMFLFVALSDLPGALTTPGDSLGWTLMIREMCFGGGGWLLAAIAMRGKQRVRLFTVGRALVGVAAFWFGIAQLLHPGARPGVPLDELTPAWIPGRLVIAYLTGVVLLTCGAAILLNRRTRLAATCLGVWIILLVLYPYGPIMIASMSAAAGAQIDGINNFADTLLFAGAILALANAASTTSHSE